jgi:hypothetical protein
MRGMSTNNPCSPQRTVNEVLRMNDRELKETLVKNLLKLVISGIFGILVLSWNGIEMFARSLTA